MKFGKLIQRMGEELPDAYFLRYKELKKMLKLVKSSEKEGDPSSKSDANREDGGEALIRSFERDGGAEVLSPEETRFVEALNEDMSTLNTHFTKAEGKVVERLRALGDELSQVEESTTPADVQRLKAAFIDFHGEIVLLLHWGLLNYAAVSKILKKHDKLTGVPLRAPYLDAVFRQPFFSTEPLAQLAEKVGAIVEQLVAGTSGNEAIQASGRDGPLRSAEGNCMDERARITQMALGTWQELKHNASTPSTVLATPKSSKFSTAAAQQAVQEMAQEPANTWELQENGGEIMYRSSIDSDSDLRTSYSI